MLAQCRAARDGDWAKKCLGCRTPLPRTAKAAFEIIKTLAGRSDDTLAQSHLGGEYYHGRGVRRDLKEAAHFFQLSAAQGEATAYCKLGAMMQLGEGGLKKDGEVVVHPIRRSADQGYATGQCNLGDCFAQGADVSEDYYAMASCLFPQGSQSGRLHRVHTTSAPATSTAQVS